nr:C-type lectin domain family 17, member A-like [Misgurnus anguillicaudatus]
MTVEMTVELTDTNTQQPQHTDGWKYYRFSYYYISSELKTWSESRRYCRERGADLIIINNKEEQDFIKKIPGTMRFWIGLTDIEVEDRWKWVDGSTLTTGFWVTPQPDGKINENCIASTSSGWFDYQCSNTMKWICEKNKM